MNAALKDVAGKALAQDVIDRSLRNILFTVDPLAGAFKKLLQDGVDAGTTKQADINGIFDLTALNGVTASENNAGQNSAGKDDAGQKVSAAGLGKD